MTRLTEKEIMSKLAPLEPLDLSKRKTVSEIVDGMEAASFGARMLGEVTAMLFQWINEEQKPTIIYDGDTECKLFNLLKRMLESGWFAGIETSIEYNGRPLIFRSNRNVLIVGPFMQREAKELFERVDRAIFINKEEQVEPGQVKDGYFPDVVFADPNFVVPVIYLALMERHGLGRYNMESLFSYLGRNCDGAGRQIGHGATTFRSMVEDPQCTVFLTLSGAMTIAQMGLVICDMIDRHMVQFVASTGALMAHGLVQGVGLKHYKYHPSIDDSTLAKFGLNRVTDTIEPETNLDHVAEVLDRVINDALKNTFGPQKYFTPSRLHRLIGEHLEKNYPDVRGILKSAFQNNVPVVVPAFYDSELGNDIFTSNLLRWQENEAQLFVTQEGDNQLLLDTINQSERIGIFTIGGGVPRNYVQNGAPLMEIMLNRVPSTRQKYKMKRFTYGCRICPDAMHFGHLSGCTYSEGESWRKFYKKGLKAEIRADATMVLPFYVRYVMDRMGV